MYAKIKIESATAIEAALADVTDGWAEDGYYKKPWSSSGPGLYLNGKKSWTLPEDLSDLDSAAWRSCQGDWIRYQFDHEGETLTVELDARRSYLFGPHTRFSFYWNRRWVDAEWEILEYETSRKDWHPLENLMSHPANMLEGPEWMRDTASMRENESIVSDVQRVGGKPFLRRYVEDEAFRGAVDAVVTHRLEATREQREMLGEELEKIAAHKDTVFHALSRASVAHLRRLLGVYEGVAKLVTWERDGHPNPPKGLEIEAPEVEKIRKDRPGTSIDDVDADDDEGYIQGFVPTAEDAEDTDVGVLVVEKIRKDRPEKVCAHCGHPAGENSRECPAGDAHGHELYEG